MSDIPLAYPPLPDPVWDTDDSREWLFVVLCSLLLLAVIASALWMAVGVPSGGESCLTTSSLG